MIQNNQYSSVVEYYTGGYPDPQESNALHPYLNSVYRRRFSNVSSRLRSFHLPRGAIHLLVPPCTTSQVNSYQSRQISTSPTIDPCPFRLFPNNNHPPLPPSPQSPSSRHFSAHISYQYPKYLDGSGLTNSIQTTWG